MAPRIVRAEEAVGKKLAYDVSIATGYRKGALFRRGHLVSEEDVELLKNTGHYYVFVEDASEKMIHEDEAVVKLARALAGDGTRVSSAEEGKAVIRAARRGILCVNACVLKRVNMMGDFAVATRRSGVLVNENEVVAVVDLIPLFIEGERLERAVEFARESRGVISVREAVRKRIGLVVTGTEIFEGRIRDQATPVVESKVKALGGELVFREVVPDDLEKIRSALLRALEESDLVIATGGMSVDPTDLTPKAIASVATEVVAYGVPVKPNTMTMLAYRGDKPLLGVSGCIVFFREWNILDILLPKLMAGGRWSREELAELGHGGLSEYFLLKKKWEES